MGRHILERKGTNKHVAKNIILNDISWKDEGREEGQNKHAYTCVRVLNDDLNDKYS